VILKGKMETVDFTDSTDWEQLMDTCRHTPKVNDPSAIPGCDQDIPATPAGVKELLLTGGNGGF
jgi:hypothetical protein